MKRKKYYGVISIALTLAMAFQMTIPAAADCVSSKNKKFQTSGTVKPASTNSQIRSSKTISSLKTSCQPKTQLGMKMHDPIIIQPRTATSSKTKTVSLAGLSQNQSQTVTIPDLSSVTNVTVNNGTVGYTVSGNQVTVNVSGGNSSQSSAYSKTVSDTIGPQLNTSFPKSKSYNDGTYSGTLNYTGYTTNPPSPISKTASSTVGPQSSTLFPSTVSYSDGTYSGTLSQSGSPYVVSGNSPASKWESIQLGPQRSTDFPSTYYYDDGTYSGTLIYGATHVNNKTATGSQVYPGNNHGWTQMAYDDGTYVGTLYQYDWQYSKTRNITCMYYSGTVHAYTASYNGNAHTQDTRQYDQNYAGTVSGVSTTYTGNYSGTVYEPCYSYNVTINYAATPVTDTTPPTINLSASGTTVTANVTDSDSGVAAQKWISGSYTTLADFDAETGATTFTGNTFTIPGDGDYTIYTEDNAGNEVVEGIYVDDEFFITYSYDSNGNLISTYQSNYGTTTYEYYSNKYLRLTTKPSGETISYTYNDNGNVLTMCDSADGTTTYSYYSDGTLATETDPDGTMILCKRVGKAVPMISRDITFTYTYDSNNKLASIKKSNGQVFNYDSNGILSSISNSASNAAVKNISYTYDSSTGNILDIYEDSAFKVDYQYDSSNELTREDNVWLNETITYTYDANGNLLTKSVYPYTTGTLDTATHVYTYQYGNSNDSSQLTNYDGNNLSYDSSGNLTSYNGWTYTWSGSNLSSASNLQNTIAYQYNSNGYRTSKTVNGVTTTYTLDSNNNIVSQTDGTNSLNFSYDTEGKLSYMTFNGTKYFYELNAQDDITGIVDSNNNEVVSYGYSAWGKHISINGSMASTVGVQNPFRYRSYYYDTETEIYYLQSRYYNPEINRFISKDDTSYHDGMTGAAANLYAYADDNPVMNNDPEGAGKHPKQGTPPPASSGYVPAKHKNEHELWKKDKNGNYGWEDRNGNLWCPDTSGDGGEHWDVINGRNHVNVGPDGHIIGKGTGHINLPKSAAYNINYSSNYKSTVNAAGVVICVTVGIKIVGILLAPETGGTSLFLEFA